MKITVFNGSPRGPNSNSHKIVEPLLEGAEEAGSQTEEVFLVEHDIKHCRGCFSCWGKTPGKCVIKDDMPKLLNLFLASDYAGMATPVYGLLMTAILKNFTDRFLPLATPHIRKNTDGSFYHEGRVHRLPRQFFIANSGFPGEHNFDLLQALMGQQKMVMEIYRNCGGILEDQNDSDTELQKKIGVFREALKNAGREMVTRGSVSRETVAQIHAPLISDEEYMAGANQYWDQQIDQAESEQ